MKQHIFTVTYIKIGEDKVGKWVTKQVRRISCGALGVESVDCVEECEGKSVVIQIDNVGSFLQEAIGMFDKSGIALFGGDIVKHNGLLVPISWVNGAYCIIPDENADPIYFTQANVMEMEKVGDIYRNGSILEKPVDESIFIPKK